MVYSWQTVNEWNLAEQVCRPTNYFDLGTPVTILAQNCHPSELLKGPVIFGASGLLYPEIAPILEATVKSKRHPIIGWGIGHNTHHSTKLDYPGWLDKLDLVGLRDFGTKWPYVPCPSCMHKAFDKSYPAPKHPVIIYDQIDYPVGMQLDCPRANNCHPGSDMEKIITFLASGQAIITSSYHGAYWGFLLNRKVLIWTPWSTKFLAFKPSHVFVNKDNWMDKVTIPQTNPGFLKECRDANRAFAYRVKCLLGVK